MAESGPSRLNPRLKDLEFLVGDWEMELSNAAFLPHPSGSVRGQVSFEWLEHGAFLMMRMGADAIWLISRDDAQSLYTVFYFDARAVSRVYEMSFFRQDVDDVERIGALLATFHGASRRGRADHYSRME